MPEQKIISEAPELATSLLRDTYAFISEVTPTYLEGLQKLADLLNVGTRLNDGYGTFGEKGIINPEVFTGRTFCHFSSDLFWYLLGSRFPKLDIRRATGFAYNYNPERTYPDPNQAEICHTWIMFTDPTIMDISLVRRNIVRLDPTSQQLDPTSPFITYTTDKETLRKIVSPEYTVKSFPDTRFFKSDKDWLPYTSDEPLRTEQKDMYQSYLESLRTFI